MESFAYLLFETISARRASEAAKGGSKCLVFRPFSGSFHDICAIPVRATSSEAGKLPVKRVVLYKNGIGYFEHLGSVRGNQDVTIPFTSSQLNDVLKSLTALDLNGGRITRVGYDSSAPVEKQLGDLHLAAGEKTSLTEILGSLRGARLEVKSGATAITGRLLSIEHKARSQNGVTLEVDYLAIMTENGELRTTELTRERESSMRSGRTRGGSFLLPRISRSMCGRKPRPSNSA